MEKEQKVRYNNFFEEFYRVKEYLKSNSSLYTEVHTNLMSELEQYLNSFVWAKDKLDRSLFIRAGKGLSINDIAEINGVTPTSLRFRCSTITHKLCDMFFDGRPLDIELLSVEDNTLKRYTDRLSFARMNFNYYTEFSDDILLKIQKSTEDTTADLKYTDEDVYDVILTLSKYSERAIRDHFSHLNPDALQYVVNEMLSGDFNITLMLYDRILNQVSKYAKPNARRIEQMQNFVDKIKESGANE